MRNTRTGALIALLAGAVCCFAAPDARGQTTVEEVVASFKGQRRVLRSYGDQERPRLSLKRPRMGNDCDVAVEVMDAKIVLGQAVFELDPLGRLNAGGRIPLCGDSPREIELGVTGLDEEGDRVKVAERLAELLESFLMTPEAYLAERGIGFEVVEDADGEEVVQYGEGFLEERGGRAGGDCWLVVYPHAPRASSKKAQKQGVKIEATLGFDAKFRDVKVLESPNAAFERQALRALSMWRCEPSVEEGELVPFKMKIPVRFRRSAR